MNLLVPTYPIEPYTDDQLTQAFNQAVLGLFLDQPGQKRQSSPIVFMTSLYASLQKSWNRDIPTARTNGLKLEINPDFFMWCSKGFRSTVLAHETWHVGFLHCDPERRGNRDPSLWNSAIDYATNWMLFEQGFAFDAFHWEGNPWGVEPGKLFGLLDERFANMSSERIYEILWDEATKVPTSSGAGSPQPGTAGPSSGAPEALEDPGGDNPFNGDVEDVTTTIEKHEIVGKVVQAIQQQTLSGSAGHIPGEITSTIDKLLNPKLPWTTLLRKYCDQRSSTNHTWRRPNRRYKPHGLYMPSRGSQDGLSLILFACDDSGSMWEADFILMNSELKGIHEDLKPERIVMVTCDTQIQDVWEFTQEQTVEPLIFTGRGGTDIVPVFDYALAMPEKPRLIIIASDLECAEPPNPGIDVLWLRFGDYGFTPSYGTTIQVDR